MKDRKKNEKLQQTLKEAYLLRDNVRTGPEWEKRVMSRVREIGPLNPGQGWVDFIEGCFWRFAPVACILILVLSVALVFQFDAIAEAEMAKTFLEGSVDYSFFEVVQTASNG